MYVYETCASLKKFVNDIIITKMFPNVNSTQSLSGKYTETMAGQEGIIEIHFWDFGGQIVYYSTHPMYLSKRCLYFLVFSLDMGMEKHVVEDDGQAATTRKTVMGNSQQKLFLQLSNNILYLMA